MILCPNCNQPFEEKAGKLFCKEHGWHKLNEAGEIIPSMEPTADEIAAANKSVEADFPANKSQADGSAGALPAEASAPVQAQPADTFQINVPERCLSYDNQTFMLALGLCGLVALILAGCALYKKKYLQKAAGV